MSVKIFHNITDIGYQDWRDFESEDFPFTDYDFLFALEKSGAVNSQKGWYPCYFTYLDDKNKPRAIWINYVKNHSYGEYIFDHEWAHAYHAHGEQYYPKLLSAVPFTPATGSKLLWHPSVIDRSSILNDLHAALDSFAQRNSYSSLHHLFIPEGQSAIFSEHQYQIRKTFQFHWKNDNYSSFDDFMSFFIGKKRKNIAKERREVQSQVKITNLTGESLNEDHARLMYSFYENTIAKMGSYAYLNLNFFQNVFSSMKDRILLTIAEQNSVPVAASICFYKGCNLFGRYWGCNKEVKHLHFELCYYSPIEFAISHKMKLFEAGAQGGHKWQRGFLPMATYSAHKFRSDLFQNAIDKFLQAEREAMTMELERAKEQSPFKRVQQ